MLSRRKILFGLQGDESADLVAHKNGYMKNAQEKWRFLANYDLSTTKAKGQLYSIVEARSSILEEQANRDVEARMQDEQF